MDGGTISKDAEWNITTEYDEEYYLIKEEVIPDSRTKLILKSKAGGEVVQKVIE